MLHTSLLSPGERSCKPAQESLARNVSLHSQAAVTCWAEGEGTDSKTCCFSGIPLPQGQAESSSWTTSSVVEQQLAGAMWTLVPPHTGQL